MGMLLAYSHMTNPLLEVNPGQSTLNRIQTTSRSGLSQTGFKPLWLNAHSRLDSVNANQCALNRIECALSVQCERALSVWCEDELRWSWGNCQQELPLMTKYVSTAHSQHYHNQFIYCHTVGVYSTVEPRISGPQLSDCSVYPAIQRHIF